MAGAQHHGSGREACNEQKHLMQSLNTGLRRHNALPGLNFFVGKESRWTETKTFAAAFPRAATSRNQRPGGDLQSPEHCSRALKRSSRLDLMSQRVSALRGQQCDCTR